MTELNFYRFVVFCVLVAAIALGAKKYGDYRVETFVANQHAVAIQVSDQTPALVESSGTSAVMSDSTLNSTHNGDALVAAPSPFSNRMPIASPNFDIQNSSGQVIQPGTASLHPPVSTNQALPIRSSSSTQGSLLPQFGHHGNVPYLNANVPKSQQWQPGVKTEIPAVDAESFPAYSSLSRKDMVQHQRAPTLLPPSTLRNQPVVSDYSMQTAYPPRYASGAPSVSPIPQPPALDRYVRQVSSFDAVENVAPASSRTFDSPHLNSTQQRPSTLTDADLAQIMQVRRQLGGAGIGSILGADGDEQEFSDMFQESVRQSIQSMGNEMKVATEPRFHERSGKAPWFKARSLSRQELLRASQVLSDYAADLSEKDPKRSEGVKHLARRLKSNSSQR